MKCLHSSLKQLGAGNSNPPGKSGLLLMGSTSIAVAAAAGAAAGIGLIHAFIRIGLYSVRGASQPTRKGPKWTSSISSHGGSRREDPFDPTPRQGALKWDEYFMSIAFLSSLRSKDPSKQVGACIVGQNKIILGIGYNGFPRGCDDHDLPWAKISSEGRLGTKYPYVVHAEANALLNTNTSNIAGATIYVTMMPCNNCAKLLIQAGVSEVVYFEGKDIGVARKCTPGIRFASMVPAVHPEGGNPWNSTRYYDHSNNQLCDF